MSYVAPQTHTFLYHAYALALGGWVKNKNHEPLPIRGVASSVLSITGGYSSASESHVNIGFRQKYPVGEDGPEDFGIYVGHAYTEVRGMCDDPLGLYVTTVRSVLDDVRINDVFTVEHAETIIESRHPKPGNGNATEGEIVVGDSNMSGVRVDGRRVTLTKRDNIDRFRTFDDLLPRVLEHLPLMEYAGKGVEETGDPWLDELCSWTNPSKVLPSDDTDLEYARDIALMNRTATKHVRYSIFKDVDLDAAQYDPPKTVKKFGTSIFVEQFGRIFFGEVFASHGTKQATMFRIDLGCDNCGGVGGSGGSTNGGPMP